MTEFVNADVIAQGISGFEPEKVALAAGRIMLTRLKDLAQQRVSFGFETRLASRLFAPWIAGLKEDGFNFHFVFLWLPSANFAIRRVKRRVKLGGHSIPEETVRRRYDAGLRNFFSLYRPLATTWRFYNNTRAGRPRLAALGVAGSEEWILNGALWTHIKREAHQEDKKEA